MPRLYSPAILAGERRMPTSPPPCRLLIDAPASGPWNMAVDEALLQAAVDENVATLRLYQWNEPTLSLGYFQRYADRDTHAASRSCAIVRRQSGGGAILHDRELTYSLTLPPSHPVTRDATALYTAVHDAFIRILAPRLTGSASGWRLRLNCATASPPADGEPFLCFLRRARGDLLVERNSNGGQSNDPLLAYKILGSAQRRHRGAILQHGSLLLEQSPDAPELPGWQELVGDYATPDEIAALLPEELSGLVANPWQESALPASIAEAAKSIENAKYSDSSWTRRR